MSAEPHRSIRSELRNLIAIGAPLSFAQLTMVAIGLEDTAIVGHASATELAGVAVGRSIGFAAVSVAMGVALALEPLASQAIGAGEHGKAWEALRGTVRGALLLVVPAVALSVAATYGLWHFHVSQAVAGRARWYIVGAAPGQFAFIAFLAVRIYLQALGRAMPSLWAAVAGNAVNVVVCTLLVRGDLVFRALGAPATHGPRLGAWGAGLASTVSNVAMLLWLVFSLRRVRPARSPGGTTSTVRVIRLGMPMGMQLLAEIGVFSLAGVLAGSFGDAMVAAHQIALGLASATFMFALGVSAATSVRVGNAVGAGEKARRPGLLGIGLGMAVMCAGALAFVVFPNGLVRAFTDDPEVARLGQRLLGIAALFQLFDGAQCVAAGALRGAGDMRVPFVANVVAHWLVGFPIALGLGFGLRLGIVGIWWGLTAGLVAVAVALVWRFVWLTGRPIARL